MIGPMMGTHLLSFVNVLMYYYEKSSASFLLEGDILKQYFDQR